MFQRLVLILFLAIILLTGCNLIASEPEVFDGQKPFMLKYNFQNALESRTGIEVTDRKFYYITEYFYGNKEQEVLEGELTPAMIHSVMLHQRGLKLHMETGIILVGDITFRTNGFKE